MYETLIVFGLHFTMIVSVMMPIVTEWVPVDILQHVNPYPEVAVKVLCSTAVYLQFISLEVPELNLTNLDKELKTLTRPVEFGIALGIPQHELEIIERDNPLGRANSI